MSKWRALRAGLIKLGPQIATGIGIGLALLAGIKAVEKTPEAIKLIEKKLHGKKHYTLYTSNAIGEELAVSRGGN